MAEVAVTVLDAYQRRGVGRMLFGLLYLVARKQGLGALRAVVQPSRRTLVARLRRLGAVVHPALDLLQVDLPVHAELGRLRYAADGGAFGRLLQDLERARARPARKGNRWTGRGIGVQA